MVIAGQPGSHESPPKGTSDVTTSQGAIRPCWVDFVLAGSYGASVGVDRPAEKPAQEPARSLPPVSRLNTPARSLPGRGRRVSHPAQAAERSERARLPWISAGTSNVPPGTAGCCALSARGTKAITTNPELETCSSSLFIDADKQGYLDYLTKLLPLVRPGGLIVAHNNCGVQEPIRSSSARSAS